MVETCLEGRYAQSEQMSEMIRVIIDSVYYDFGRIYSSGDTDDLCDKIGNSPKKFQERMLGIRSLFLFKLHKIKKKP